MPAARTGPSLKLLPLPRRAVIVLAWRCCRGSSTSIRPSCSSTADLCHRRARVQSAARLHGPLSFGHSAYFGTGAYAAFIVRDLGVHSMELCILGGLAATLLISALFGYVCVRHAHLLRHPDAGAVAGAVEPGLQVLLGDGRHRRHPRAARQDHAAGRPHGLQGRRRLPRFVYAYYYYVLVLFLIAVAVMWVIVHSPFGKALQAIRDNETRASFVGVPVRRYRWIAFVISGSFTGLAGALWVPLNGLTADILYWPFSGEIVFMTVLGGFRTFTGPIVGAIAFNYLKVYAVASSQYWQMVLGVVLVVLVMVLPTGIVGTLALRPS